MMKWLIHRRLAAFEKDFGYNADFMHHVLDTDFRAFMRFGRVGSALRYRKDVPDELYYAVALTGTIGGDCGPCAQLGVTMALREGVPGATLASIVRGNEAEMTDVVRLGVRYARAVLARQPIADEYRADIVRRWGERAVVTLALALVGSQIFPTFKYALGYGHACQRLVVEGASIVPQHAAAAS